MGSHFRRFVLVALAALLLAPLTSSAASSKHKADSKQQEPPTRNPYANKPYAGCEGGYCPARNPEVEAALYKAAASGDAAELQRLLDHPELNSTRNIVPDKDGFVRVVDAAVWVAAKKGRLDSMKVRVAGLEAGVQAVGCRLEGIPRVSDGGCWPSMKGFPGHARRNINILQLKQNLGW